ncbi:hypothetical protein GGF46_000212 [Coemansia sp. RSA 552]|nr:hypothetical protein GGF46_000212 [Coemansia sp. RSA 552]
MGEPTSPPPVYNPVALPEKDQSRPRHASIIESEAVAPESPSPTPTNYDSSSLTASVSDDESEYGKPQELCSNPPPPVPDGGYGWVVVVCCFLLEFFAEGPMSAFGVFQDYYVNEQFKGRTSNATISLIGVLSSSCMAILGVVSGKLCERFGYKTVPICGVVILSLGYLLASFATEPWHLLLTQGVLCGVGAALTFLPAAVVPSQWFEKRRGLATGTVSMGVGVGGIVWTQFNHLLIQKLSVAWVLRLTSMVVLGLCTTAILLIRTHQGAVAPQRTSLKSAKDKNLILFLSAAFFTGISSLVPFFYLPGVNTLPVFVGLYYTASGIGYLFGPPIAGVVLEKTRSWGAPYIALKIYAAVPMVVAMIAIVAIRLNTWRGRGA